MIQSYIPMTVQAMTVCSRALQRKTSIQKENEIKTFLSVAKQNVEVVEDAGSQ